MNRTVALGVLEQVRVASPCTMRWEEMQSVDGERIRHCAACDLDVYNLSGMSRADAESLIRSRSESRLCIRMFRRADGTVLTTDCPVGWRAARLKLGRALTRVAAAIAFLLSGAVLARARDRLISMPGLARVQPFAMITDWVKTPQPAAPAAPPGTVWGGTGGTGGVLMGSISLSDRR